MLCGSTEPLSLHHVLKHPRDDLEGNLAMLCGSGTTGCHGLIEAHDDHAVADLGVYLWNERPDVLEHLTWRLKTRVAAEDYVQRMMLVAS